MVVSALDVYGDPLRDSGSIGDIGYDLQGEIGGVSLFSELLTVSFADLQSEPLRSIPSSKKSSEAADDVS